MTAAEQQPEKKNAPESPFFEITRGEPTHTEVAVLSAVFATAQGNAMHADHDSGGIKNDWGALADRLRPPFGYNPSSFLNRRQY